MPPRRYRSRESLQVALDNFKDLENGPGKDLLMLCDYKPSTEEDIAAALEACTADDMKLVDRFQKQSALCLLAAKHDFPGLIAKFVDKGAEINYQDGEKCTALTLAVLNGHTATVRVLVNKGADVSLQSCEGETPLDIAKEDENQEMIAILEQASA